MALVLDQHGARQGMERFDIGMHQTGFQRRMQIEQFAQADWYLCGPQRIEQTQKHRESALRLTTMHELKALQQRSEERRDGKEWVRTCCARGEPYQYKKKKHKNEK